MKTEINYTEKLTKAIYMGLVAMAWAIAGIFALIILVGVLLVLIG